MTIGLVHTQPTWLRLMSFGIVPRIALRSGFIDLTRTSILKFPNLVICLLITSNLVGLDKPVLVNDFVTVVRSGVIELSTRPSLIPLGRAGRKTATGARRPENIIRTRTCNWRRRWRLLVARRIREYHLPEPIGRSRR